MAIIKDILLQSINAMKSMKKGQWCFVFLVAVNGRGGGGECRGTTNK